MTFIVIMAILFIVASIVFSCIKQYLDSEKENSSYAERCYAENLKTLTTAKRIVFLGIAGVLVIVAIFSSIYTIDETKVAYTMTFGKTQIVESTGIHFKAPFITKVKKHDATSRGMAIGFNEETNELESVDSLMITSDFNFLNVDFYVEYRVIDPIEYDFGSSNPELILNSVSLAAIRNTVGLYDVDSVLTTGKAEVEAKVKSTIIENLQEHKTGLSIINVTMQDVEPPTTAVSDAFKAVENAIQNAEKLENDAKAYENAEIPKANAEAEAILNAAEATKTERINQASQEVAEFVALYNEYKENPDTVKLQLYLDAMEEILPEMEIIIGKDTKVIQVSNENDGNNGQ